MSPESHAQPFDAQAPNETEVAAEAVSQEMPIANNTVSSLAEMKQRKEEARLREERVAQAMKDLNRLYGSPVDNLTAKQQEVFLNQKLARYSREIDILENGGKLEDAVVLGMDGLQTTVERPHGDEGIVSLEASLREKFGIADVDAYLSQVNASKLASLKSTLKGLLNSDFGNTMYALRHKRAERDKLRDTVAKINQVQEGRQSAKTEAGRRAA